MPKNNKGFTLIELLVVIAIIGVLSSIVLASLNSSRVKGYDASIKADISHLRASAEVAYSNMSNSYGTQAYTENCGGISYAAPLDNVFEDTAVQSVVDDAISKSGQTAATAAKCLANGTYYVIAVQLRSSSSNGWCVDSLGNSKQIIWANFANVAGDTNCTAANTP